MAGLLPVLLRAARNIRSDAFISAEAMLGRFVANHDGEAFAELVRRHGPVVYGVCRRLVGPSDADDAFQATFLVLAARAASIKKAASVGSWLIGVAGRVARQMRKQNLRRTPRTADDVDVAPSNLDRLALDEHLRILDEEVTLLSDRLRAPVVCCILAGKTQEQAASELGVDARTVRRRLDEAKRVLRVRLERRGVVPTVAVGLVAISSPATATIPFGLLELLPATLASFFAGQLTPPTTIAQGVIKAMSTIRLTTLVGLVAIALSFGVGMVVAQKPDPPLPNSSLPAVVPAAPTKSEAGRYQISSWATGNGLHGAYIVDNQTGEVYSVDDGRKPRSLGKLGEK